jgi:hypothetical protein
MKRLQSQRGQDILSILLLISLAFIFWGGALRPEDGRILYGFDLERLFHPFGDFMYSSFRDGKLPLWNPYFFLGFPQYAEPQISTFYPLTYPMQWLPLEVVLPLQYAIHYAIAGVGGYVLIRQLGGKTAGALLTGVTLAFALTMTVRIYVGHMPHIMTLAWMPWILASADWAVKKHSWVATLVAALPLGLAFLVGYVPFLLYVVAGLSLYMLWLAVLAWRHDGRRAGLRAVGQWMVLGAFAFALAAVQLLPSLEFTLLSNRAGDRYNFANSFPIELNHLITVVLPDIFGAPVGQTGWWLNLPDAVYWEWALYVGILPFVFYLLTWPYGQKKWRFWIVFGVIGILAGLGDGGALHRVLYDYVPGANGFRFVGRAVYFFSLSAAVLLGLMFDTWFDVSAETHAPRATLLRKILFIFIPVMLILIVLSVLWQGAQPDAAQIGILSGITSQFVRLLLLMSASLALLIWGYGRPRWLLLALAMTLMVVDLWGVGNKFITDKRDETELAWQTADVGLPENRLDYRVWTRALPENDGYYHGFYAVYGYDGFSAEASEVFNDLAARDARIASLLSARYLIYGPEWSDPPTAPGWEKIGEPAGATFWERADAGPRTFIVHDVIGVESDDAALEVMAQPELDFTQTAVVEIVEGANCGVESAESGSSTAQIVSYEPEKVVISADASARGWLVLNDLYYPGWQVTVDGQSEIIQPTDYALRGVCVPAGEHEIVFEFKPQILTIGAWISAVAGVVWIVAVFIILYQRRTKAHDT